MARVKEVKRTHPDVECGIVAEEEWEAHLLKATSKIVWGNPDKPGDWNVGGGMNAFDDSFNKLFIGGSDEFSLCKIPDKRYNGFEMFHDVEMDWEVQSRASVKDLQKEEEKEDWVM